MPWTDDSDPGPWRKPAADAEPPSEAKPPRERPRPAERDPGPWGEATPPPDRPRPLAPSPDRPAAPGRRPDPPRRPDLQALSRRLTQGVAQWAAQRRPPRFTRRLALGLAAVTLAAWAASGVYRVEPGETAVVSRFGAVIGAAGPGWAYHLPAPVEAARPVSFQVEQLEDDGVATAPMLTSDDMLVQPDFQVRWRVSEAMRYLADGAGAPAVKADAVRAVRRAIGRVFMADLQGAGLARVQADAAAGLQAALDRRRAGVTMVALDLHQATPAEPVAAAFRDVATARQEAQGELDQAKAYRDRAVDTARLDAGRTVRAAGGYSAQATGEADGEAARFTLLDAQYRRYPEVTRQRLYTEMMEHVLRASNKVVVQAGKGVSVTLPPDLFKPHATPDTPALPVAPGAPGAAPMPPARPQAAP